MEPNYTRLLSAHRNLVCIGPHSLNLLSPPYLSGHLPGRISQVLLQRQGWILSCTLLYSQQLVQCQEHSRHIANICNGFSGFMYPWDPFAKVLFSLPPNPHICHHPPRQQVKPHVTLSLSLGVWVPQDEMPPLTLFCHTHTHPRTSAYPLAHGWGGQESLPSGFYPSPNLGLGSVIYLGAYLGQP